MKSRALACLLLAGMFSYPVTAAERIKYCKTAGIYYCTSASNTPDSASDCGSSDPLGLVKKARPIPHDHGSNLPGWVYYPWEFSRSRKPDSTEYRSNPSLMLIYVEYWRNKKLWSASHEAVYVYDCKLCPPGQSPTPNSAMCTLDKTSSPPNNGNSCNNSSRPINISTGNKYYSEVDYQDRDFIISRAYNSFAKEWSFNYRQKLYLSSIPGQMAQTAADGSSYYPHEIWAFRQDGKLTKHSYSGVYTSSSPYTGERLQLLAQSFNSTLLNNAGGIYLRGSNGLPVMENDQIVAPDLGNTHALQIGAHKELYDIRGRLTNIDQASQNPITLSYVGNTITVSKDDRSLIMHTDAKGRIVAIKLPDDSELTYSYGLVNGSEVLLSVERSYSDGSQATLSRYLHEDTRFPTYITGVENANGDRISSVQYDAEGRAISSEAGPLGSGVDRTTVLYNKDGSRTITNALGKQSIQKFTQINGENRVTHVSGLASVNCAAANQSYTYDTNGLLLSKTDWQGNATTYRYNDQGQEISRTEAAGTEQARTVTTDWHPTLFLPVVITEPNRVTRYQYDDQGRQLSRAIEPR